LKPIAAARHSAGINAAIVLVSITIITVLYALPKLTVAAARSYAGVKAGIRLALISVVAFFVADV
jgi:hypothetical protein